MASGDAEADDLGRLEAALDRIAAHARRPGGEAAPTTESRAVDTRAVTARLDRLISQLQDALAEAAADPALSEA